jgi:hypothetical protein
MGSAGRRWVQNSAVGQWLAGWRTWNPWLMWLGAVDIAATVFVLVYLVAGHGPTALKTVAVVAWVLVVPGIASKQVVRLRRR